MRTDTAAFAVANTAPVKRPRYVIEIAFDSANLNLWYFTSHTDAALPPGGSAFANVLEGISGTSQVLSPDKATASIGSISFRIVDRSGTITNQLGSQLALGRSTRRQRVRVYVGYEGLAWSDYSLVQTQLVSNIEWDEGVYTFRCTDIQREMRKEIFQLAKTRLASTVLAGDTTINVFDTATFTMIAHCASYSDSPSAVVGYIKIQDEVIKYTGITSTSFTGCTRGALNTRAVEHAVDLASAQDQRTPVDEYVYLEMPALKLAYGLLTGRMPAIPLSLAANTAADDYTTWAAGVTPAGWFLNQDTAGEASFAVRAGPNGDNEVVMCCKSLDTPVGDPGPDGGWGMNNQIAVDKTKPYMFTCLFKRLSTGLNTNGQMYWGLHTNGTGDVLQLDGSSNTNPYFYSNVITAGMPNADQWYLVVGFVHENGYGTTDTAISGVYDLNGTRISAGVEYKWPSNTTLCGHRAYHYYNQQISGEIQQMARPRLWQVSVASAPALIKAIVNSISRLPTKWNLGIDPSYVNVSDFTNKLDLYDSRDDSQGFIVRMEALEKTDGKKFIEQELALLCGSYMPVYASGALGWRRMSNILSGAAYTQELNERNVVDYSQLTHDFDSLHNQLQIKWNFEPLYDDFTRITLLIDQNSITVHGKADPLNLSFRGLHGSRHSSVMLAQRFDALRDRYSGPPLRMNVRAVPSMNGLEIGDIVRVRLPKVRDFVTNATLDRSFEIQNVKIDWVTGQTNFDLFASSQAPGALAPTTDATVLSNAWYTSQGTDLSTVLTITGSNPGHISANGTITGSSDMTAAPSIFYYNGDLQLDAGKTINVVGNVQLRVKGFFQNNGILNGKGGGFAGAASAAAATATSSNPGTPGLIGVTEPGGGIYTNKPMFKFGSILLGTWEYCNRGTIVRGAESSVPAFNISWNGTTLSGLPTELRGSSGSSGLPAFYNDPDYNAFGYVSVAGGAGGASGAGLLIVCRGFAQGAAGKVDLSGADGVLGGVNDTTWILKVRYYAGSGAGGAPGGLLIILDGSGVSATGLSDAGFVALNGKTPIVAGQQPTAAGALTVNQGANVGFNNASSYYQGTGDGTTFRCRTCQGARGGSRVQYVPNNSPASDYARSSAASLAFALQFGLTSRHERAPHCRATAR
jgi:hypothetical protein